MSQAALCIGGPLDGLVTNGKGDDQLIQRIGSDYTYECVYINKQPVLYFYLYAEVSLTAALHSVFAAYAKKGKK